MASRDNEGMIDYLKSFELFSKEEIDAFLSLGTYESMPKDSYFFEEGNICTKVAFITSGIFRHFYRLNDGEPITYCFSLTNNFVAPYSSFISEKRSSENIQAITNAHLFVIPKLKMDKLINENRSWLMFSKKIAEKQYIKREKRIFVLQKERAINKYKALVDNTPEYVQHIPLGYLASYLGISQRHLSRMRKELSF